jgi:phage shock protein PspC (stress-responsive transcriptional regulator)
MRRDRIDTMIVVMSTTEMPAAGQRRLTRSRDDRMVAGVCGGTGRYFDIDPVIPRVVLAVLAVFGGAGLVIYALGWLLLPEDGEPTTRLERWLEGRRGDRTRDLVIVIAALIALSFAFNPSPFAHRISGAAFVIIVVLAVATLVRRRRGSRTVSVTGTHEQPFGPTTVPYGPPATYSAPVARRQRERSWLGWLTLGATLLVAGVMSVVAVAGWAHPQPADVLAASIAVVGVGVLVGAVAGRAWAMVPVGLLLVGFLAVASALPRHLTWTAGDRQWAPIGTTSHPPYVLGVGDARLDLTRLPQHQATTIVGRVGVGRLIVTVPSNAVVNVNASVSAGQVDLLGNKQDGTGVEVHDTLPTSAARPSTLTLNLQMGFGNVEVRHAAA